MADVISIMDTETQFIAKVRANHCALRGISEADQTRAVCFAALECDWGALNLIHNQTDELCWAALKKHGMALQCIKQQTFAYCIHAITSHRYAFKYVREKTLDICLAMVRLYPDSLEEIVKGGRLTADELKEVCCLAVRLCPRMIQHSTIQTPGMRHDVVATDGLLLRFIWVQTPELRQIAVRQNAAALQFVKNKTADLIVLALGGGTGGIASLLTDDELLGLLR